jgi:hypothetical protein
VADQVASLADKTAARLIVVAGDVRALQLLREHLPERTAELLREVDGSRAPGSGLDEIADDPIGVQPPPPPCGSSPRPHR